MTVVLGALDNSAAGRPVLATTVAVARVLGAEPIALHVREDGVVNARAAADTAGVELEIGSGPVVASLVAAARRGEVAALVVGARGTPGGRRPVGHIALELLTTSPSPVVVVPPLAPVHDRIARILVGLDGRSPTTSTRPGAPAVGIEPTSSCAPACPNGTCSPRHARRTRT